SALQIQQAVLTSNLDFPTGSVKTQNQDILVRLAGKYKSIDELRNLVVATSPEGGQVRLKDVADIQDSQKDVEKIARVNGESALVLQVLKQSDANAVEVSRGVQELIEQLHVNYEAEGLRINIANDSSTYTLASANAV